MKKKPNDIKSDICNVVIHEFDSEEIVKYPSQDEKTGSEIDPRNFDVRYVA